MCFWSFTFTNIFSFNIFFQTTRIGLIPESFPPLIHHIMTLTPSLCSLRCIAVAEPLPGLSSRYQALEYTSEMQDMSPWEIHSSILLPIGLKYLRSLNKNTHGLMMMHQHFKLPSLGSCRLGQTCIPNPVIFCNRRVLVGMVLVPIKTIWLPSLSLLKPFNFPVPNRRLAA